jgi:general stress protein YciG
MDKFTISIDEKAGIKNMIDKEGITVAEAGRRGGRATLENQGPDFFKKIGRKGGRRTAEMYREVLAEFGRKGGRPRRPALY